jgi:hypothetical protein
MHSFIPSLLLVLLITLFTVIPTNAQLASVSLYNDSTCTHSLPNSPLRVNFTSSPTLCQPQGYTGSVMFQCLVNSTATTFSFRQWYQPQCKGTAVYEVEATGKAKACVETVISDNSHPTTVYGIIDCSASSTQTRLLDARTLFKHRRGVHRGA